VETCQRGECKMVTSSGPCSGKSNGDSCNSCPPDAKCSYPGGPETCEAGVCAFHQSKPDYDACAGKSDGDRCNRCAPGVPCNPAEGTEYCRGGTCKYWGRGYNPDKKPVDKVDEMADPNYCKQAREGEPCRTCTGPICPAVVETCQRGECKMVQGSGPCAGKSNGASCTNCPPNAKCTDPGGPETCQDDVCAVHHPSSFAYKGLANGGDQGEASEDSELLHSVQKKTQVAAKQEEESNSWLRKLDI